MEKLKKELKRQKDKEATLIEEKNKMKQVQLTCPNHVRYAPFRYPELLFSVIASIWYLYRLSVWLSEV